MRLREAQVKAQDQAQAQTPKIRKICLTRRLREVASSPLELILISKTRLRNLTSPNSRGKSKNATERKKHRPRSFNHSKN